MYNNFMAMNFLFSKMLCVLCVWSCSAFCAEGALNGLDKWVFVKQVLQANNSQELARLEQRFCDAAGENPRDFCVQQWKAAAQETLGKMKLGDEEQRWQKNVALAMEVLEEEESASLALEGEFIAFPEALGEDCISVFFFRERRSALRFYQNQDVQRWVRQGMYPYKKMDKGSVMQRYAVMMRLFGSPKEIKHCVCEVLEQDRKRNEALGSLFGFVARALPDKGGAAGLSDCARHLFFWGVTSFFCKFFRERIKCLDFTHRLPLLGTTFDAIGLRFKLLSAKETARLRTIENERLRTIRHHTLERENVMIRILRASVFPNIQAKGVEEKAMKKIGLLTEYEGAFLAYLDGVIVIPPFLGGGEVALQGAFVTGADEQCLVQSTKVQKFVWRVVSFLKQRFDHQGVLVAMRNCQEILVKLDVLQGARCRDFQELKMCVEDAFPGMSDERLREVMVNLYCWGVQNLTYDLVYKFDIWGARQSMQYLLSHTISDFCSVLGVSVEDFCTYKRCVKTHANERRSVFEDTFREKEWPQGSHLFLSELKMRERSSLAFSMGFIFIPGRFQITPNTEFPLRGRSFRCRASRSLAHDKKVQELLWQILYPCNEKFDHAAWMHDLSDEKRVVARMSQVLECRAKQDDALEALTTDFLMKIGCEKGDQLEKYILEDLYRWGVQISLCNPEEDFSVLEKRR